MHNLWKCQRAELPIIPSTSFSRCLNLKIKQFLIFPSSPKKTGTRCCQGYGGCCRRCSFWIAAGALAFVVFGLVPIRSIYTSTYWPVIVLLGMMLPVVDALSETGTANLLSQGLLSNLVRGDVANGLVALMVVTFSLSALMNNAATATVMCPIAISTAHQINANVEPF